MAAPQIVIIGAGPTGLGAAWRLEELGYTNWTLLEASDVAGGLAGSVVDEQGFTWDYGGHVHFSHYDYFDQLMVTLLGDEWIEHVRESWIWMRDRFIPYPLQNNIWRLPQDELIQCLNGLLDVTVNGPPAHTPANFREWLLATFGSGLCETFLFPYNRKVWAYDAAKLNSVWVGERVATVDLKRILSNVVKQQDDVGWGPNAKFRFPKRGGTGAIWQALWNRLPAARKRLGARVTTIDPQTQQLSLTSGEIVSYDRLMSTVPLDDLLRSLRNRPDLSQQANQLVYSSVHIVGVGFEGTVPKSLETKNWMYFPEADNPFFRATVFSNYSPFNVPVPERQWSLLCEVSESDDKPEDESSMIDRVLQGIWKTGLAAQETPVVSVWHQRLKHGYPTPFCDRNPLLDRLDAELRLLQIWSRGRFGAWKYEVSNQDHSLMQGVEAVDHILFGTEETTYRFPGIVNAGKSPGRTVPVGLSWS